MKKFSRAAANSKLRGLSSIVDTFNRANNSSLGAPSGNSSVTWQNQAGTWQITSNSRAGASSAVSSQPVASLTFSTNSMTVGVEGVGPGYGTAFWITDGNNWYGTYVDVTQTCSTCYNAQNCNAYSNFVSQYVFAGYNNAEYVYTWSGLGNGGSYGYGTCPSGWSGGIPTFACGGGEPSENGDCCSRYVNSTPNYNANYGTQCNAYNASNAFTCNCVNNYTIKLIRKLSGAVSQLASWSFASIINSFETIFNGSTGVVTVKAYNGSNYTTQIGSNQSHTVTSFTPTNKHGIMATSVTYAPAQGSSVDSFKAN